MPHRRVGRNLRFRISEIEEWLAGTTANGRSDESEAVEDQLAAARYPWLT
jgi:hypothetical protein